MIFDQYQQEVIDIRGGRHLVLAPPGCGKTELLTHRILNAHKSGVPYDDMLCLTFTNRAARSMRERIAANTDGDGCDGLYVGNIHRFCSRFLFENALIPSSTGIIDELDQRDILDEFGFTKYNDNCATKKEMISVNDIVKLSSILYQEENGHGDDIKLNTPVFSSERARGMASRLATLYFEYKKEHNLIDFDDILLLAYSALSSSANRSTFSYAGYHWIQVDEVQDLNALQLAIIDLITASEDYTVLYLGDEQQAIYSFMGAKLGSLQRIAEKAGERGIHRLYTNYRSPKYLVDMLNCYAEKTLLLDNRLLPKPVGDEAAGAGALNLFEYKSEMDQLCDIPNIVKRAQKAFPSERIAVLVRSNKGADEVSAELAKSEIPHFRLSGQDPFRTDEFKTVVAHYSVVNNDTNYFDWARILWKTRATLSFTDARRLVTNLRDAAMTPSDLFLTREGESYLQRFIDVFRTKELVIFDTESTGLDVHNDDIIQIAAVKTKGGVLVKGSEFNVIIRTEREIPERLGSERNPMIDVYREAEKNGTIMNADDAFEAFLTYIDDDDVLGHNVEYDYRILKQNLLRRHQGCRIEEHIKQRWDSLKLIRLLEPRLRVYKLRALLETFGLEGENSHRADDDILATKSLVDFCVGRAPDKLRRQEELWGNKNVIMAARALQTNYLRFYADTLHRINEDVEGCGAVQLVEDMKRLYGEFVGAGYMGEVPGMNLVFAFLESAFPEAGEKTPALREQILESLSDFRTFNQADLCDSNVISDKVFVMTVHKAKGLEFEHVVLCDAVVGTYPFFMSSTNEAVMEDARLFYVGLSRSKKRISVLYQSSFKGFPKQLTSFMDCIVGRFGTYHR